MLFSSSSFGLSCLSLLSLVSAGPLPLPRATANLVKTPLGSVQGSTASTGGGSRYTVRYASASKRWADSVVSSAWSKTFDGTAMPPSCPQASGYSSGSTFSEDCLYHVVYSPKNAKDLPVMVWIHGGSFVAGSANAPGLDGSIFAEKEQVVVVVLQYRLGVLGLLPPSSLLKGTTNLAVQDVVNALTFLQTTVASFGGNPSKVTVAGQSSGGQMIRALLTNPKTHTLFRAAILQSDPMNYGMSTPSTTSILTSAFYSALSGYASTLPALQSLDIDTLISMQSNFVSGAFTLDESIPLASPIRPTSGVDAYVPYDFAQGLTRNQIDAASKPILLTTVKDELGTTIGGLAPDPITAEEYAYFVSLFAPNEAKANAILASSDYAIGTESDAARTTLLKLGTESIWTCAVRGIADLWREHYGNVYVGEIEQGTSYGNNPYIPYCSGKVCHEDDIYGVFGTRPGGGTTSGGYQTMLRWGAFVRTGEPQLLGTKTWEMYNGESTILTIGPRLKGPGVARSCPAGFWGTSPTLFDWQAYS